MEKDAADYIINFNITIISALNVRIVLVYNLRGIKSKR